MRALTIGVEEELQLIDPETLALAPGVEKLLGPAGLKTELFSCLIETNTPVCESADEARGERPQACLEALHADVDVEAADELAPQLQPELLLHL